MTIRYPAIFVPEETGGFTVLFPDLEDTFTCGETEEECLFNAAEVLSAMLEVKLEDNDPIPPPSANVPGARYVAPDAKTQAALLVRFARGSRPLSEVARALHTSWPAAKRLEDPRHWPSLKTLDKAAAALGKRLVLSFE
jgi:antitoxin HicB